MAGFGSTWLCLLAAFAVATSATRQAPAPEVAPEKVRPIRKVITLLEEMKAQVEREAKADLEAHEKFACWCETNEKAKTAAVEAAEKRIEELDAVIASSTATAATLRTEIEGLGQDIAADRDALAGATGVRGQDYEAFRAEEADVKETRKLLGEAVQALTKVQFLQKHGQAVEAARAAATAMVQVQGLAQQKSPKFQRVMQRDFFDIMGSLQEVARGRGRQFLGDAPSSRRAGALAQGALLPWEKTEEQLGAEAKPNDLQGEAAGAKSYSARSSKIVGILAEMRGEFTRDLASAQKEDFEAEVAFQKLRAAKLAEIASASEQKDRKEADLADTEDKTAKAKEDKEATIEALGADRKFLVGMTKSCKEEAERYQERYTVRTEEAGTLAEALKILTEDAARDLYGKTMTLLQADSAQAAAEDQALERSMRRLAEVARRHQDWSLASLAVRVRLDGFARVKEVMDKMLSELQKQQKEEHEKREFCNKQIDETEDEIKRGENTKEDLEEKAKALDGSIATLTDEIEDLKRDVASMEVSLKQAGEERRAQNSLFQSSVADQRATVNILNKALARLRAFYALPQTSAAAKREPGAPVAPPPPKGKDYQRSAGAGGVLQLLAKIIKDAEVEEQELQMSEQRSQQDYGQFVQDASSSLAADRDAIARREKQVEMAKGEKSETEQANLANEQELSQLGGLLKAHHLDCDFLLKFFDVRQKARAEEMDAIADAKAILSGADFGK